MNLPFSLLSSLMTGFHEKLSQFSYIGVIQEFLFELQMIYFSWNAGLFSLSKSTIPFVHVKEKTCRGEV